MKSYIEENLKTKLKEYRDFESSIDISWGGKKRLENLVTINLGMKFGKAEYIFKESLQKDKPQIVITRIDMMYRAYEALIQDAKNQGYSEIISEYRCYKFNDDKLALVCDLDAQLPRLRSTHKSEPNTLFFSVEELFRCIPRDFMHFRGILAEKSKDVSFKRITYK